VSASKIKKSGAGDDPAPIALVRNPDVLAELGANKAPRQLLVGFAAETSELPTALAAGRAKLAAKNADLLVVNLVGDGRGFEVEHNAATILRSDGSSVDVPLGTKAALADAIWDELADRWGRSPKSHSSAV
jgi:phosphopantothenoylcysteine decarboxylase/phosphopantothenate--cysteine ligase